MKNTKGITLIALIITIIVMLILVSVSINIAIKTGLFEQAGNATKKYREEQEKESNIGKITVGGVEYDSVEDYIAKNNGTSQDVVKWVYVDNGDGTVEITGLDLSTVTARQVEKSGIYSITLILGVSTVEIPSQIDGKKVVSFSLKDTIVGSPREGYIEWMSDTFNINDVIQIIIPATIENIETFKVDTGNEKIAFPNMATISFPNGKNENLTIPEDKWGASKIIIEGVEQ